MPAFCLSIHASYRCAHSGACCSDVWAVPLETHVLELIRNGELALSGAGPYMVPSERPEAFATELVAAHHDGRCAFYEVEEGLCSIHRQRGADALPSSCRHFPRIHLVDGRGTFVTLSHFCPTAARMLLEDVPVAIVEARPPLALDGIVEGLNALDALPPLVRPDLLAGLDGYAAWERECVNTLGRPELTHVEALDAIERATEIIRDWRPGAGPLAAAVARAFERAASSKPPLLTRSDADRLDMVDAALPSTLPRRERARTAASLTLFDGAVKRYLASRLFGTWLAYRTRGLRSIVEWLRICLAVLRNEYALNDDFVEAVRETDRVLLHVIHLQVLAAELEPVERD